LVALIIDIGPNYKPIGRTKFVEKYAKLLMPKSRPVQRGK